MVHIKCLQGNVEMMPFKMLEFETSVQEESASQRFTDQTEKVEVIGSN